MSKSRDISGLPGEIQTTLKLSIDNNNKKKF